MIGMNTVNSPPYTVTGLTANTTYNVTVGAINTCCGAGPVSDPVMTNMRERTLSPTHITGNVIVHTHAHADTHTHTYVTGYWKTDHNVTLGQLHFIGPATSHTHALSMHHCIMGLS